MTRERERKKRKKNEKNMREVNGAHDEHQNYSRNSSILKFSTKQIACVAKSFSKKATPARVTFSSRNQKTAQFVRCEIDTSEKKTVHGCTIEAYF